MHTHFKHIIMTRLYLLLFFLTDEFQLVLKEADRENVEQEFTVPCHLSPTISAVDMEIRWFKETECVFLYKNRKLLEGRSYRGRVNLLTEDLEGGNVSLNLRDFRQSDVGDYVCQVTSGNATEEITVKVACKHFTPHFELHPV